ncbi:MAG TPA: hypothetical protein EYQ46_15555 [Myxococcales bacterium]|nr:hypothetical protein [Myxococcales bacterium]
MSVCMRTRTRSTVAILSAIFSAFILTTLATPAFAGPLDSAIIAVADFNEDGVSDLLAEKVDATNSGLLWVIPIDPATSLRLAGASGFPLQLQEGYEFLAVGNFDGNLDGQSQIAARKTSGTPANEIGAVRLWDLTPDGTGLTTALEGVMAFAPDPVYRLIGVGDLDANGVDDFVFEQTDCGTPSNCPNPGLIRAYLMAPSMALLKIAHPLINAGFLVPHEVFGVADVNIDGFADIVLARRDADPATRPNANGNLRTFLMQGDGLGGLTVSGQAFAFDLPTLDYDFVGFVQLDRRYGADLLFEKTSGTNAGLIQARLMEDPDAMVLSLPYYITNVGTTSSYIGNGLFDGDLDADLVLINNTTGFVRVVLLDMDPSGNGFVPPTDRGSVLTKGRTFPVVLDGIEWANRATGAVTFAP